MTDMQRAKFFKVVQSISVYLFVFVISVFIVAEIFCRIIPNESFFSIFLKKTIFQKDVYFSEGTTKVHARIAEAFFTFADADDPLLPPYPMYPNTYSDDEHMLEKIFSTRIPPRGKTLSAYDFLRAEEVRNQTIYTANINDLGFRDPPRKEEKPPNTFRILVLGSYSAFGYAVSDQEAYARQLEKLLQTQNNFNLDIEVWNAGIQSTTAIVGLARLKYELLNYSPDLIILDYGFADVLTSAPQLGSQKKNLSVFLDLLKKSAYLYSFFKKNLTDFTVVMDTMLEITEEKNIPVFVIRQSNVPIPIRWYKKIVKKYSHAKLLDGRTIFRKNPPSAEIVDDFYAQSNWLTEDFKKKEYKKVVEYPSYQTNCYHYNKWGHRAIAQVLDKEVRELLNIKTQSYK